MKIILQIECPYVHGKLQVSWIGEVLKRVNVFSDALTVNTVPVIIEGVLVRSGDVWRAESFGVMRVAKAAYTTGHSGSIWKPSRRNQERAREVVLDVVSKWAGGRPREIQPPRLAPETREDGALLVELLGA